MSALISLPVAALEKRYSIWLTSGIPGARSAATSDGSTQAWAVWVIEVAKPTMVRCGGPGTPVTVTWVPIPIDGPNLMLFQTTWPGCVGQWPDSSVRSSTGPPGEDGPPRSAGSGTPRPAARPAPARPGQAAGTWGWSR